MTYDYVARNARLRNPQALPDPLPHSPIEQLLPQAIRRRFAKERELYERAVEARQRAYDLRTAGRDEAIEKDTRAAAEAIRKGKDRPAAIHLDRYTRELEDAEAEARATAEAAFQEQAELVKVIEDELPSLREAAEVNIEGERRETMKLVHELRATLERWRAAGEHLAILKAIVRGSRPEKFAPAGRVDLRGQNGDFITTLEVLDALERAVDPPAPPKPPAIQPLQPITDESVATGSDMMAAQPMPAPLTSEDDLPATVFGPDLLSVEE